MVSTLSLRTWASLKGGSISHEFGGLTVWGTIDAVDDDGHHMYPGLQALTLSDEVA